ncbi:MAG: c-type cytochrome [Proteobacteria bacterium]|nr:c-type cytochrome [Pseudomonadota bacterium]
MSAPDSVIRLPVRPAWHALRSVVALPALMAYSLAGHAQTPPADPVEGQKIASQGTPAGVAACAGCHGAQGEGNAAFPRLAGTGADYLRAQLDAFAEGSRKNGVMQPFAQKLSAQERASVALYYSGLTPPQIPAQVAVASADDAGGWLAQRGRWPDNVPACAQCHGPNGVGVGSHFPPLAGLPAAYIAEQLQAWKAGTRPPGPMALMAGVARKLSDAQIDAVSKYYAGLAAVASTTASSGGKP